MVPGARSQPGESATRQLERIERLPEVDVAELDLVGELASHPGSARRSDLPDPVASSGGASAGCLRSLGTGAGVTVAVLDTGISQGGVDLDCHTFVHPYDALTQTATLAAATDSNGHGTHVAGTVAQCTNNGIVGAGVAPEADLMPIKVVSTPEFGEEGTVTAANLADGIIWAIAHDADVLNMSLGFTCVGPTVWPDCSSLIVDDAIAAASSAGAVLVAAAGNDGGPLAYPANHPDVLAVGALNRDLFRAFYSSTGGMLSLMAPGGDVSAGGEGGVWQETVQNGVWGIYSFEGTSMASPHVAGAAAVLRSAVPFCDVRCHPPSDALHQLRSRSGRIRYRERIRSPAGTGRGRGLGSRSAETDTEICRTKASVGLVDAGAGLWRLLDSSGGVVSEFFFGNPGDVALVGDWDCDGVRTPAMYRQSNGYVYLRNSNTQGVADVEYFFGDPCDVPLAGDFDGDGCDTLAIYRPSEATVVREELVGDRGGGLFVRFGNPGDTAFVGDFDGDGVDTVGLHRASTGLVYFRNSNPTGVADARVHLWRSG